MRVFWLSAIAAAVILALTTGPLAAQTSMGTAFTYQGQLKETGGPVNGTTDFEFSLWDAAGSGSPPSGGMQIGGTQSVDNVAVTSGLFTVELNAGGEFGATAFNGDARWLEIAVRSPAGSGSFTTLAPRQPITAVPYALYALNAGVGDGHSLDAADGNPVDALFVDNVGNVGIGTTSPGRRLDVNGSATLRGSMFFDTPGILEVAHENNTGMRIDPASNSVQLETDGSIGLTLTSSRNVGIGTNSPLFPLHVETNSTSGRGVFGLASAATGDTYGGYFQSQSTTGLGLFGWATAASGGAYGVKGQSDSTSGRGVFGLASAATGTTNGGYFESTSDQGRAVYAVASAASGWTYGVYGKSDSPSGRGVYGHAIATTGDARGVFGLSNSTSGLGTVGYALATTGTTSGVYGQSDSTSGRGVYGLATATSGTTYGVYGQSDSSAGFAGYFLGKGNDALYVRNDANGRGIQVFAANDTALWASTTTGIAAVDGRNASTSGRGVYGYATSTTGINYGVYGRTSSMDGRGVYGTATTASGITYGGHFQCQSTSGTGVFGDATATSGITYGVQGHSDSTWGRGVFGSVTATTGTTYGVYGETKSTSGRGVYGVAGSGSTSGSQYGVYGYCSTLTESGYAVYANGDMGASGTKSFRIDHPDDPENKYLLHYSIESPEVLNAYSGKVTLDGVGQAVVELPRYFAKINEAPRYTLTAIGAPMPNLHVAEEISEQALKAGEQAQPGAAPSICSFRIAGGVPSAKVSWEVKALRNDVLLRTRGTPVERDKTGPEHGRYQHPELYGQPRERGMDYHEDDEAPPVAGPETAQN